jgi:ABC-type nitrate/sulfonate/bicarbonate transport system substrate-binding protein
MTAEMIIEEINHLPPAEKAEVVSYVRALEAKCQWTPEELEEAAERLIVETDPVRVEVLKARITAGFYGDDLPNA